MQPRVQQRLTNLIRGGMAVTLATTLMVPTTALAEANAESSASNASAQGESAANAQGAAAQAGANGQDWAAGVDAPATGVDASAAGSDEATYVADGDADDAYEGDEGSPALDTDATADEIGDGNEKVTIIVQLEEQGNQGISLFSRILGTQTQDRHSYFKDKVREIAAGQTAEEAESDNGISLLSLADEFSGASDEADDSVDELHDYYNVIDGFAVKAPAKRSARSRTSTA